MANTTYTHDLPWAIDQLRPGQTVLGRFDALASNPVLAEHGAGEGDALLRFAFYFAGKGSGLLELELPQRKREALRLARVEEADPRHAAVLSWESRPAVLLCNEVVRLSNDLNYSIWYHLGLRLFLSAEKMSETINAEGDISGDKEARMYLLAHDLGDRLLAQRGKYQSLTDELFLGDEELAARARAEKLAAAGAVGARAAEQSFVTGKPKIQ